jgi:hypothetical protein
MTMTDPAIFYLNSSAPQNHNTLELGKRFTAITAIARVWDRLAFPSKTLRIQQLLALHL